MKELENNQWLEDQSYKVDRLYSDGNFTECKRILLDLLEQEPGYGRAHYQLGNLYYMKLDEYAKAEYHLKLAMKFAPKFASSYCTYLYMLNYLNRHEEVVRHAQKALKIPGVSRFTVYHQLGKSCEKARLFSEAKQAYKNAQFATCDESEINMAINAIKRIRKKRIMKWKRLLI